jgi:hypothetical protein
MSAAPAQTAMDQAKHVFNKNIPKQSDMIDFIKEIVLYAVICILIIIIVNLFHYTIVQARIKRTSRCYREKVESTEGQSIYSVKGVSLTDNIEIFEIIYDFKTKDFTINQLCPTGPILNRFAIPVYNMKTYVTTEIEKLYQCEEKFDVDNSANIIFKGHPELVRFMQFQNTDFFDKKLIV